MTKKLVLGLMGLLIFAISGIAQEKTKGEFVEPFSPFFQEIQKGVDDFNAKPTDKKLIFKASLAGMDLPKALSEFKSYWYNEPVSQGLTGTCWSFSTTSYFESEIYRVHNRKVKLSELHTVYWEYVEKAKRFVQERGNSNFAEGSEADAVKRIFKQYGAVPLSAYSGLLPGQKFHDHTKLIAEMTAYLESVKKNNQWDEATVVATIKSILNHYIGAPPEKFTYEGDEYTAKEFFDYIDVLSVLEQPFYKQVEYTVADNWWHSKGYYNVPVDEFMKLLKNAIRNGYTLAIGGDVSEAGYDSRTKCAIVPTFDIPSEYIDDYAREFRFDNGTTGDDHGIHLVGYMTKNGKDWFLIKDSGAGSKNVDPKGYYYYHEDYVKLKIMDFMCHKDGLGDLLTKFK